MNRDLGFTLTELLVASSIGVVILLAMAHVDVSRVFIGQQAQTLTSLQADPQLAVSHIAKHLIQADRIAVFDAACTTEDNSGSCLQIRIPTGLNFDQDTNYRWVQYRHTDEDGSPNRPGRDTLQFYEGQIGPDCTPNFTFSDVRTVSIGYVMQRSARTNTLTINVASFGDPESGQTFTFTDQVVVRGAHETGLGAGLGSSSRPAACR